RGPVVGRAPLPVADPLGEVDRSRDDQHRRDDVERGLERARDVPEDLAVDRRVVVPLQQGGGDARDDGDHREGDAEPEDQVVGPDPAARRRLGARLVGCGGRAHDGANLAKGGVAARTRLTWRDARPPGRGATEASSVRNTRATGAPYGRPAWTSS